jgi:hypothetical protein
MKQKLRQAMFIAFAVLMLQGSIFAQDTLNVPAFFPDSGDPALLDFILADTLDGGTRANPDRVYKLGRDSVYIMRGQLRVDFNLSIIADDDPTESTRPPIIVRGKYDDGVNVKDPFVFIADSLNIFFKNIIFTGVDLDRKVGDWTGPALLNSDYTKVVFEKCVFNQWDWVIYSNGKHNSIFIKDSNFRNNNINWHPFVGQQFYCGNVPLDTLSITNTTYFNDNAFIVGLENNITDYFRFEHNTVYTTTVDPIRVRFLTNAKIVSNIFYGPHAIGETEYERNAGWYTSNGKHASIIDLDTVATDLMEAAGLTEADRNIEVDGNAYFWPQAIKDFWTGNDSVSAVSWMNVETQSMFDDDTNYPLLVEGTNLEEDPQFTNTGMEAWTVGAVVGYADDFRNGRSSPVRNYDAEVNGGEMLMLQWPLPETLQYANTNLMTAGHDDLPVGDLNWYPEQKIIWEENELTGISKEEGISLPSEYTLSQNYPNPFNPSTIINFSIPTSGVTTLKVFNILGQEVATLVNKKLSVGAYRFEFDASELTTGVYVYKLQSNNYSEAKKMMLLK